MEDTQSKSQYLAKTSEKRCFWKQIDHGQGLKILKNNPPGNSDFTPNCNKQFTINI